MEKERILVVDDEKIIRELCRRTLATDFREIKEAQDAAEAMQMLKDQHFDLVITDIVMPGMNGMELIKAVNDLKKNTGIIIITGYPTLEIAINSLKEGAYDFIIKPFSTEKLRTIVQSYMEKREANVNFQRMRKEIEDKKIFEELEKLKDSFLAIVSHELKTPLSIISGYLDLMTTYINQPDQLKSFIEEAQIASQHLNLLINQLLEFSRLRSGEALYKKEPADVIALIKSAINKLKPLLDAKELALDFAPCNGLPVLNLEKNKFRDAILNLINNAINFTPEGGKITIQCCKSDEDVKIKISDTGVGIPKEHLDKVFNPFYQVQDPLTREVGGMGLGLSIAKNIIQDHGGDIMVESAVNSGSTFTVVLPIPHRN